MTLLGPLSWEEVALRWVPLVPALAALAVPPIARLSRTRVTADALGLRLASPLRTEQWTWAEVERVEGAGRWLTIRTTDGRFRRIHAGGSTEADVAEVAGWLQQRSAMRDAAPAEVPAALRQLRREVDW